MERTRIAYLGSHFKDLGGLVNYKCRSSENFVVSFESFKCLKNLEIHFSSNEQAFHAKTTISKQTAQP